ncbi:MAG: hypothetical protein IJJ33_20510, partial [Victivallales bacterium]|nr:hypothetical protein [Victivallales bacterium]
EQPAGSFRINDKICLTEMDHRTDFSELGCRVGGFDRRGLGNATGDRLVNAQIRRDFGMTLTQGEYAWICTIAGYNTWSENYHAILGEYLRAAQATLQRPLASDWGKIAFFQDLKAKRSSGRPYGFGYNTDRCPRKGIMTSGVGFSDYLVEDIGNPRLENGKIYIFANNVNMTAQQVDYITGNLQKNGNILVFTFATALNTEGGFEPNIQALTGMRVCKDLGKTVLFQYAERQSDDPLAKGLAFVPVERGDRIPLFWVDDTEATPLAWHESDPTLVAAAVRRFPDWTAVYLANGYFGRDFPRALVQEAGLLPDGPAGDVTLAGNSLRILHAATGGLKELRWDGKANLLDLQTGQLVGYSTDCYRFMARPGDTRWFKIVK